MTAESVGNFGRAHLRIPLVTYFGVLSFFALNFFATLKSGKLEKIVPTAAASLLHYARAAAHGSYSISGKSELHAHF